MRTPADKAPAFAGVSVGAWAGLWVVAQMIINTIQAHRQNFPVEAPIPLWVQRVAAVVSIVSMAGLLAIQLHADAAILRSTTLRERAVTRQLTTVELAVAWGVLGLVLFAAARRRQSET